MKNLQTFNEFVNESELFEANNWKKGDSVEHTIYGQTDKYTDAIYDAAAKALGCTISDLSQFTTEDDTGGGYEAAETAFMKGSYQDVKLKDSGMSGPFLSANKKAGICKLEEQGFGAYIYNWEKARF